MVLDNYGILGRIRIYYSIQTGGTKALVKLECPSQSGQAISQGSREFLPSPLFPLPFSRLKLSPSDTIEVFLTWQDQHIPGQFVR